MALSSEGALTCNPIADETTRTGMTGAGLPPTMVKTRKLFLRGLGVIFLVAFSSFYCQSPGLYGDKGLEPVYVYLRRASVSTEPPSTFKAAWERFQAEPTLLWFHGPVGITAEEALDVVTLAGMATSLALAAGLVNATLVALTWLLYLSLVKVGQTFMSFQWDILLCEVGFASIWMAPALDPCGLGPPSHAAVLLLRWTLFKLMLMSGAVKVSSRCPTWLGLTACHYHFATQCIPTPVAWFLHNLPGPLLKASVAATLFLELPAPLLLVLPWRAARATGAALQALLQVLILASGNYTYFNWLTLLLCVPVLDDSLLPGAHPPQSPQLRPSSRPNPRSQSKDKEDEGEELVCGPSSVGRAIDDAGPLVAPLEALERLPALSWGLSALFLAASFWWMFRVERAEIGVAGSSEAAAWDLELALTPEAQDRLLAATLTPITLAFGCLLLLRGAEHVATAAMGFPRSGGSACTGVPRSGVAGWVCCAAGRTGRAAWALVVLAATASVFLVSSMHLLALHQPLLQPLQRWPPAMDLFRSAQPWRISSGYGLFRRMTGVGDPGGMGARVSRPEVELQGSVDGGQTWHPYVFKYKPGPVDRPPPWVAPHQPRLDWQMWFAALGRYQGAPWLLHLVSKLLHGEPSVMELLDSAPPEFGGRAPDLVRAELFHYDLTRPSWGRERRLPGGGSAGPLPPLTAENISHWWVRRRSAEYLPPLERDNPSLKAFLSSYGWDQESGALSPLPPPKLLQGGLPVLLKAVTWARQEQGLVVWAHICLAAVSLAASAIRRGRCSSAKVNWGSSGVSSSSVKAKPE